ncbi:MAG: HNH endonuclease [Proteobacteria bacterium]|nr:MAG: HNH endonuclease [Pseudomonadota bacterium]
MRKSAEVPALLEAIRNGSTTVSKARKICSVVTERNSKEWIELTQHCSTRIVEKAVAMANPRVAVVESIKYVSANVLELKLAISEGWSELLADVKDLMSQKSQRAVSTEEALFQLMADYKRKHDPVAKAERVRTKKSRSLRSAQNLEPQSNLTNSKRYIRAGVRHEVAARDRGQCTFVDRHGKHCGSKRWIQTHHVTHFAEGGAHTLENLETLCWAHHSMKHRSH